MSYPMQPPPRPPRRNARRKSRLDGFFAWLDSLFKRRRPRSRQAPPGPSIPQQGHAPAGQGPNHAAHPAAGQPSTHQRQRRRGLAIGPATILGCMGIVTVIMLGFLIAGWLVYDHYSGKLEGKIEELANLTSYKSFETTVIYDRNGNELYKVAEEGLRTRITISQVPQHLIDATIAVEDNTFYENRGIDIPSILRAASQYVRYGYIVSGGSTITQQLIRNVLFTDEYRNERTLDRKIDEALLAVILTQRMSKDEILEIYLNEIYYGNWAYGIEAAAQTYFGKPAANLTLGEAALLAGLPQAPANLDPLNPDPTVQRRVMERRRLVLNLMTRHGYITQAQADAAFAEPLVFVSPNIALDSAPHFVVYARSDLEHLLIRKLELPQDEIKRLIARGGLQVYTTVDMNVQRLVEDVARRQVSQLSAANHLTNAAVVVMRPETGEILAMVGSVNYDDETIDGNVNVTIAARQPGSALKPFTYAAALEQGWSAASVIWDTETHIGIAGQPMYSPRNYDRAFHGPVRVRDALANSYNIPAVQTLRQIGVDYLLWMLHRVGITTLSEPSRYGLSLTLGGGEVTPLELTNAYSVLANHGYYVPSASILCVTNASGEIIYEYERQCPATTRLTNRSFSENAFGRQVMDDRIAFIIGDILADNTARSPAMGSNSPLHTPGLRTSVKTGTTDDFKDNWTVGYTRNVAIGVWAGNTDNTPMQNVSGLQGAAPIWRDVMTGIYGNPALINLFGPPLNNEERPAGVSQRQICTITRTSLRDPATSCTPGIFEWFLDYPAAIPDNNGNMIPQAPTPPPLQSANGPQPVEIEPGLIRVAVFPVAPDLANVIASMDPIARTVPPRYCQVPIEVVNMFAGVQDQLFIVPPPIEDDAYYARLWAQNNGVAILPQFACNEQMLSMGAAQASGGSAPAGVTAYVSSPTPGQTFSTASQIDIIGTATWGPGQAQFYKIEIQGGSFSGWVTLGDVGNWHNQSGVSNGVLESIMPYGLPTGSYVLQLVIVGPDSNVLGTPYQVPFYVG